MELPDPERWDEIKDVLVEVHAHPPPERAGVLDEVCRDDDALRDAVKPLLEAESTYGALLDRGAAELAQPLIPSADEDSAEASHPPLTAGRRVGAYQLEERIGEGGTSVVYRARRADEQFERTVAVKVLRGVLGREQDIVERFRAERQILASVSHPHLADVYDGGVLPDGRPYLVMEYVDGRPITEHCRAEDCSLEDRLALFRQAAEAVQAAHEQLVVHRDLKPSNVLVERTTGQVKLLDFGIAKLLGELPGGPFPATRTGRHPMTPAYAAPEQVEGEPIRVTTDIYALGVLLYELLTDETPYDRENLSPYAVARAVCEDDPPLPSSVVDAPDRRTALQGDLDAIVMKALRKTPGERYDTVDDFVDDVDRYQTDRPVQAQRGGWAYRARKFVRRHRGPLVGGLATVLLLAGFGVYHVQQIAAERDHARREARKAEEVTNVLTDIFKAGDLYAGGDDAATLEEVLRRGRERVEETLDDQPVVQAEVFTVLGEVYRSQARYDSAQAVMEAALRLRQQTPEAEPLQVAESWNELGTLFRKMGRLDTAAAAHRRALELRRQHLPENHANIAGSMNNLAAVLYDMERHQAALPLYRKALKINRERLGDQHENVAAGYNNLAGIYYDLRKLEKAEEMYRKTLELDRDILGNDHPYVATDLSSLGLTLYEQEKYEEAEEMLRRSLELRRQQLGETHPDVAISLHNLAYVFMETERYDQAEEAFRDALRIRQETLEVPHPRIASNLHGMGSLAEERGEPQEAEEYYRKAVAMQRKITGRKSIDAAGMMIKLAHLLRTTGRFQESEKTYRAALAAHRPLSDTTHPDQERIIEGMAQLYDAWGKPDRAASYRDTLTALQDVESRSESIAES